MPQFQTICKTDDVAEGTGQMFVINEQSIGIFHVNGEFFALDNRCPHAGASLAHGIVEGDSVACRIHHWRFCIRDGRYVDSDQPPRNARCYPIRVVGQEVQVEC